MPIITCTGPKIDDLDVKRELVKSITAAAVLGFSMPEHAIIVVFEETKPENVAVGGELIIDRSK